MSQPLSFALPTSSAKTAMPTIAHNSLCKIKFTSVAEDNMIPEGVEAGEKKPTLNFRFDLVDPVQSTDGKPIEPGKPGSIIFERVYLRDKNNLTSTPPRALETVGKIQDALDNTGDSDNTKGLPPRANFDPAWVTASVGKQCWAEVVVDGDYGNKIKRFYSLQDPKFQTT